MNFGAVTKQIKLSPLFSIFLHHPQFAECSLLLCAIKLTGAGLSGRLHVCGGAGPSNSGVSNPPRLTDLETYRKGDIFVSVYLAPGSFNLFQAWGIEPPPIVSIPQFPSIEPPSPTHSLDYVKLIPYMRPTISSPWLQ